MRNTGFRNERETIEKREKESKKEESANNSDSCSLY
jgi:hypothetical protein